MSTLLSEGATDASSQKTCHQKCGFVAIVGQANAGKSTLVNTMAGQKVSIVSSKPHTTRYGIYGIVCHDNSQMILVDTPGIIACPQKGAQGYMSKITRQNTKEADIVVVVIDATAPIPDSTMTLLKKMQDRRPIVALNKVDSLKKDTLLPLADQVSPWASSIVMISGKKNQGLDALFDCIHERLNDGPWLFGPDDLTQISMRFWAAEMTREKLFDTVHQEIPYQAHVVTDKWDEGKKDIVVHQTIFVTKDRYKKWILGHKGQRIRTIGLRSRTEMGKETKKKIHLFLDVAVDATWEKTMAHHMV